MLRCDLNGVCKAIPDQAGLFLEVQQRRGGYMVVQNRPFAYPQLLWDGVIAAWPFTGRSTAARPDHAGALYRWGWGGRQRQILAQRKRLLSSLPTPPATEECLRCNTNPFLSAASPQVPAAAGIAPDSLMVVQMSGHEC